mgnify:CR=1 FL=1
MTKSRSKPYRPPAPSTEQLRALAIQLFDRKDGSGADWQGMTDCLFRLAFQSLDKLPEDARHRMAVKVHAAAYDRVLATEAGSGNGGFSMKKPGSSTPDAGLAPSIRPELAP